MKKLLIASILSLAVLSGCSLHSKEAFKKAKQENPLEIPPDLNAPSRTGTMVIPPANGQASGGFKLPPSAAQRARSEPKGTPMTAPVNKPGRGSDDLSGSVPAGPIGLPGAP